ncbi:MAG TPA: hypothetical protein VL171_19125 [Verrucomicrobiae bacterium]|nr:hypothetical protein [Verrucomicrobiae bacterium]
MKSQIHPVVWPGTWTNLSLDEALRRVELAPKLNLSADSGKGQTARPSSVTAPLRFVRILAFCQALIFLVLFLFMCAWAGARTVAKSNVDLRIVTSSYAPKNERNPFVSVAIAQTGDPAATTSPVIAPGLLKLDGVLYDPVHPSAVVNGQLVGPKRAVKVPTAQGEIEVKALQIARESILLEVGGQKLELWLSGHEPNKQR